MGSVRKRGKKWYIRWIDSQGLRHEQVTNARNKSEAQDLADEKSIEAHRGQGLQNWGVKFTTAYGYYKDLHLAACREGTQRSYGVAFGTWWLPVLGDKYTDRVRPEDIAGPLVEWGEPSPDRKALAASTRRLLLTQLSGFYTWAVDNGYATTNPCDRVRSPEDSAPTLRTVTPYDADRILEKVKELSPRYYTHLYVLYWAGLRIGELKGLVWADWNKENPSLRIWRTIYRNGEGAIEATGLPWSHPKTRLGDRLVYIPNNLDQVLRHWQVTGWYRDCPKLYGTGGHRELMFPSISGHPMHEQVLRDALREAARAVAAEPQRVGTPGKGGITPVGRNEFDAESLTLHHLRHGYARRMLEMGMTLPELQRQMGHSNFTTTMQYADFADPVRPRVFEAEDRLLAEKKRRYRERRENQ